MFLPFSNPKNPKPHSHQNTKLFLAGYIQNRTEQNVIDRIGPRSHALTATGPLVVLPAVLLPSRANGLTSRGRALQASRAHVGPRRTTDLWGGVGLPSHLHVCGYHRSFPPCIRTCFRTVALWSCTPTVLLLKAIGLVGGELCDGRLSVS